uniref:BH3-interacting domain death agonist n=1 Tax=Oreochromis niloticus TaxID=8128 RepID=A0A669EVJ0_ORENI
MDHLTNRVTASELIFAFLQEGHESAGYMKELHSLGEQLKFSWDINSNGHDTRNLDNGELETDGYHPSNIGLSMQDLHPIVDLQIRGNLSVWTDLFVSAFQKWKDYLAFEVERVMMRGVGPDLPQERVIIALALTLVKRVCVQTPQRLRNLFHTALQYINFNFIVYTQNKSQLK